MPMHEIAAQLRSVWHLDTHYNNVTRTPQRHGDVIKWKHFPRNWPFVRGIHRSPVSSPHKGQWRVALMFSLICVSINDWVNNREVGDLRVPLNTSEWESMDWRWVCPFQICDTRESIRYILTNCAKEIIKPACSNIMGLDKLLVFSDYIIDVLPQRFWILWIFINNIFIILLFCAFYNVIDIVAHRSVFIPL